MPGPGASADAGLTGFVPYVYRGTGRDIMPGVVPTGSRSTRRCKRCGRQYASKHHKTKCAATR
jgi:hypothetical protein